MKGNDWLVSLVFGIVLSAGVIVVALSRLAEMVKP